MCAPSSSAPLPVRKFPLSPRQPARFTLYHSSSGEHNQAVGALFVICAVAILLVATDADKLSWAGPNVSSTAGPPPALAIQAGVIR